MGFTSSMSPTVGKACEFIALVFQGGESATGKATVS